MQRRNEEGKLIVGKRLNGKFNVHGKWQYIKQLILPMAKKGYQAKSPEASNKCKHKVGTEGIQK